MAIYRNIHVTFWTDSKIVDDFTPYQKYMYLYLLTNNHTNLCGCYEISENQIANETGLTVKKVRETLEVLDKVHHVVMYDQQSREMLLLNWYKWNWTDSPKFKKPLMKEIENIKSEKFKYLLNDRVSIRYQYGIDRVSEKNSNSRYGMDTTVSVTVPVTDTVSVTDSDSVSDADTETDTVYLTSLEELKKLEEGWIKKR